MSVYSAGNGILRRDFLHAVKSYGMGQTTTSPPKEVALRIYIALKHSSSAGLNPRTLSPMASTITIRPPITAILDVRS
jgi:hypothetical protein